MKNLSDLYGDRFFKRRYKLNWRAQYVCQPIVKLFKPKSAIDVGCAIGDLVDGFIRLGVDAYGLEGSKYAIPHLEVSREKVFIRDLREKDTPPFPVCNSMAIKNTSEKYKFDLVTCFEVLEHIEPEYADNLVHNLASMSDLLIVSAAGIGQGGVGHFNCQPPVYWELKFKQYGFYRIIDLEEVLKKAWEQWRKKPGIKAYYQNLIVFKRPRD